ncbi:hypothetical protein [Chryseobacterium gleum]|uniref:hypothetical protein n=1 Tax=Chryseobacterium gleum TaxID=250 RepID=UPI0013F16781|nr:hypothetical protein [Chryseobacterium gleum]
MDKTLFNPDQLCSSNYISEQLVEKEEGNFMVARGSNQLVALTAQGWDAFLNQ